MKTITYPGQAKFAFTIFDDTDLSTIENVKPIYDLLGELNLFTTKSVWVSQCSDSQNPFYGSGTLEDSDYLDFIRQLKQKGFEIAFHGATMDSSVREITLKALERFRELLGEYPKVHVNHCNNRENIYWGADRLDFPLFSFLMKLKYRKSGFEGHIPGSRYFWGDVCRDKITYVRNFVFREINLLKINPTFPYRDDRRPFVNYWFSSSEGANCESFNQLISFKNQDRLEKEGGVCIVYTHFASGFVQNGKVNTTTKELLTELSKRNGWFVPVSTLLDFLRTKQRRETLSVFEHLTMEIRWFLSKMIRGSS